MSSAAPDASKIAIALAARAAMRAHRKGKPIAFQSVTRPAGKV